MDDAAAHFRRFISSRHDCVVDQLKWLLTEAVGDAAIVRVEERIQLDERCGSIADIVVARARPYFHAARYPSALDSLLVIEVSEETLTHDLRAKVPLYAWHDVPEVWVADLVANQFRIYRFPVAGEYSDFVAMREPAEVELTELRGVVVDLGMVDFIY